jgi:hypothetical protein
VVSDLLKTPRPVEAAELDHDLVLADDELELVIDGAFEGVSMVAGSYWKLDTGQAGKLVKRIRRAARAKGSKTKKALEAFEQKAPFLSLAVYLGFVILLPRILKIFDKRPPATAPVRTPAAALATPSSTPKGPDVQAPGLDARHSQNDRVETPAAPAGQPAGGNVVGHIGPARIELSDDRSHHTDGRASGRPDASVDDFFRSGE